MAEPTMLEPTMLVMMERHTVLDSLFLEHQTAILERDFARAARSLESYRTTLFAHVAEEEAKILPLYDARAPQPAGGQTKMFRDEHARLRVLLDALAKSLAALGATPAPKAILAFLDEETQYRHYMDHHDRRERAFLYPGLDSVLSVTEREALLAELG